MANALVVGPTITLDATRGEVTGVAAVEHAPVHLLPIEVRKGSALFEKASRQGLVEGGFLHHSYRFADERTALMARAITGFPTRLLMRSVPVAMYDLAYNLGIVARLGPVELLATVEELRATYLRIARAWNVDQASLLSRAAEYAERRDVAALNAWLQIERPRVAAIDASLLSEVDACIRELERRASTTRGRRVTAHLRGRLMGALALSMSLAACSGTHAPTSDAGSPDDASVIDAPPSDSGSDASNSDTGLADAGALCADPTREPSASVILGCRECASYRVRAHVDDDGNVVSFEIVDDLDAGVAPSAELRACLEDLFATHCYPSSAGQTVDLSPHCWIA